MSQTLASCNDCQPSESWNPKQQDRLQGGKAGAFGDVRNPLADELKDIERVKQTYSLLPIVPFFDNGDATLRVFRMLKDLSPTQGSCITDIGRYVLGGEISIETKKKAGFASFNQGQVKESDKETFADFVESLNPTMAKRGGSHILNVAKGVYQNKKTYGNSFVRLNMVQVGKSRFCYIENIDAENVRYWATMPNEPKSVVISALWDYDYILRNTPEMVGVYPNISDNGNGVLSTIFHDFEKVTNRDWYGQPDSVSSIFQQFAEMQQGQYFTEGYASDFAGRVFFEYVGTGDEDSADFDEAVQNTFTNKAGKNKKRVVMRMRLPEDTATTVHEFGANTEHEFHLGVSELTEKEIIKTHGWNKILMGIPQAGKLGGSAEFMQIYQQKNETLINPLRVAVMQSINLALEVAEEFITGKTDLTDTMSLGLADLFTTQTATTA